MSLYAYKVFDTVVRYQSFAKAAEIMNLTPSAISRSVATLERKFGFKIFIRNKKGVKLTNEGDLLSVHVSLILSNEEKLQQVVDEINGMDSGCVVIGAFSSVCSNWVPDIVKSFRKLFPNIQVKIMQGDYEDVFQWTKEGVVDIGFTSLPIKGDLVSTPIYKEQLICITSKEFVPKNSDYITVGEIENQTFVLQREGYNADTISFVNKNNLTIKPEFFIDSDQSILAIVESGLGISIVPELILSRVRYDINIYPIKPKEFRTIGLVTRSNNFLSPATSKMYEHIITYMNNKNNDI